jgi:hypothetical protein
MPPLAWNRMVVRLHDRRLQTGRILGVRALQPRRQIGGMLRETSQEVVGGYIRHGAAPQLELRLDQLQRRLAIIGQQGPRREVVLGLCRLAHPESVLQVCMDQLQQQPPIDGAGLRQEVVNTRPFAAPPGGVECVQDGVARGRRGSENAFGVSIGLRHGGTRTSDEWRAPSSATEPRHRHCPVAAASLQVGAKHVGQVSKGPIKTSSSDWQPSVARDNGDRLGAVGVRRRRWNEIQGGLNRLLTSGWNPFYRPPDESKRSEAPSECASPGRARRGPLAKSWAAAALAKSPAAGRTGLALGLPSSPPASHKRLAVPGQAARHKQLAEPGRGRGWASVGPSLAAPSHQGSGYRKAVLDYPQPLPEGNARTATGYRWRKLLIATGSFRWRSRRWLG